SVAHRFDQGPLRSFGFFGKRNCADEPVGNVSLCSQPACEYGFSPCGIHEHPAGKTQDGSILSDFEDPSPVRSFVTGTGSSRQKERSSRVGGCGGEHGIKAGSINVPAAPVRVLNEILVARSRRLPRG